MIQYQLQTGQIIQVPENFVCPISRQLITDPAQANDGFNYQKESIQNWLKTHNTSPFTRSIMSKTVIQNTQMKKRMQAYWKIREQLKQANKRKQAILQAFETQNKSNLSQQQKIVKQISDLQIGENTDINPQNQQLPQLQNKKSEYPITKIHDGIYKGQLKDGKRNGHGILILPSGDMYQGNWLNDKEQGFGIKYYKDMRLYKGYWKQGKCHGENCQMHHPDGNMFDGTVVCDISVGYGKFYLANGRFFQGNFQNNQFGGEGKMTFPNGTVYIGNWKSSTFSGFGKLLQIDGLYFQGGWLDGKKDGRGKVVTAEGQIQTFGDYKADELHGYAYHSTYSSTYKGYYVKGVQQGYGEQKTSTGCFWGEMKQGKPQGYGRVLQHTTGNYYEGQFKGKRFNGKGKCYYKSIPYPNCYFQGEMVDCNFTGYGKCTFDDGSMYIGDWKNFKRQGFGTYVKFKPGKAPINKQKNELRTYVDQYKVQEINNKIINGQFEEKQSKILLQVLQRKHRKFEIQFDLREYECFDFEYIYQGEWINDRMQGMGIMKYPDGSYYQGSWVNNLRNGKGKLVKNTKNKIKVHIEGQWENGKILDEQIKNFQQLNQPQQQQDQYDGLFD